MTRVAGIAAVLSFVVFAACATTRQTHASIAGTAYAPITSAKAAIEASAFNDAARLRLEARPGDDLDRQIALLREQYAPLERAMSALILAYNAYVDAIQGARSGGDDAQLEAARALLVQWRDLRRVAGSLGIPVEAAPAELVEFTRSRP